jgi:hypothetical protein
MRPGVFNPRLPRVEWVEDAMSMYLDFQEDRANRDLENSVMLTEIESMVAPLRRLDERTRASIMVLVGLAELVTANQRSLTATDDGLGAEFVRSLQVVHGEGARILTALKADRLTENASPLDSPLSDFNDVLQRLGLPALTPSEFGRHITAA